MKRILLCLIAAGSLAGAAAPAFAQGPRAADWQPLSQRRDNIALRIDQGVATGAMSDLQARDLRDQFQGLLNLEDEYSKSGLTLHQREDLQARYDTLSARIGVYTGDHGASYAPAQVAQPYRTAPDPQQ